MATGEVLRIQADDPVAVVDFPHFCSEQGHDFISHVQDPGGFDIFEIRKG